MSLPAFAIGARFIVCAVFTIISTVSVADSPLSSEILSENWYAPTVKFLMIVTEPLGFIILKDTGPEILVHNQVFIVPSGSLEPVPSRITLSRGKVIIWSGPANATGGLFASAQPSHEYSFLHERLINAPLIKTKAEF